MDNMLQRQVIIAEASKIATVAYGYGCLATGECAFVAGAGGEATGDYAVCMSGGGHAKASYAFVAGCETTAAYKKFRGFWV